MFIVGSRRSGLDIMVLSAVTQEMREAFLMVHDSDCQTMEVWKKSMINDAVPRLHKSTLP